MRLLRQGVMALGAGAFAATLLAFAGRHFAARRMPAMEPPVNPVKLKPVSAFADIKNANERAVALFEEAGKVIMSPRCMNCHPATERPTQTNKMTPHQPLVVRGEGGMGAAGGLACNTCHHETNFDPAGVPGHPQWHLAPLEMAWQGDRSAKSASRSRTLSATTARTWLRL